MTFKNIKGSRVTKVTNYMRRYLLFFFLLVIAFAPLCAQRVLTLEACRTMALSQGKPLEAARLGVKQAQHNRAAARTSYLPKLSLTATYVRTFEELSLLSDEQKHQLSTAGTNLAQNLGQGAAQIVQQNPELAPLVQGLQGALPALAQGVNGAGLQLVEALRTDTRNMSAVNLLLAQPLYTGGKIRAYNRLTRYAETLAGEKLREQEQETLLEVDRAYWQVVSLAAKHALAVSYRDLLVHTDNDVQRMVAEGIATRADELAVAVKRNEADMALTRVENGLALSRMLLCRLCGLPLDTDIQLQDEGAEALPSTTAADTALASAPLQGAEGAYRLRPELLQLEAAVGIYQEKARIARSEFLPQLALTGGYLATNPGLTNGFENRFRGMWSVGAMLTMPLWHWGEGLHKVRAAQAEADIARLHLSDARELITLQVAQGTLQLQEAQKRYAQSAAHRDKAEENLRTARIGFAEGVIPSNDLIAASTAWLQALSDRIDAFTDVRICASQLSKARGTLAP